MEAAWRTYNRHYDDLNAHERKRVRQRMALIEIQRKEATPAMQVLAGAMELLG